MNVKSDSEVQFSIIGLGNLFQVIWHCITESLGGPDLAERVIATTMDESELDRKREFFRIPVQLGGNLEALKKNRPDIIMFAPPPKAAPSEIDTTLVDYFAWARENGHPLPEIYAFPPMPSAEHYLEVLGSDVLACNIIPNNVKQIVGKPVIDEGYYVCSFAGDWPRASKDRLKRIFASQGAFVEAPPDKLAPMLGGTCTVFCLWQVVPVLAEILREHGEDYRHNHVGGYLRTRLSEVSGFTAGEPRASLIQGPVAVLLDRISRAWFQGTERYYREIEFPDQAAHCLIARGFDLILHTTECEPREVLDGHAIGAATKGGVLEKAITVFHQSVKPVVTDGVRVLPDDPGDDWQDILSQKVLAMAHSIGRHALRLAN